MYFPWHDDGTGTLVKFEKAFLIFGVMADVHDKQTRSYNMSRIKGKNTKPEMLVRRFLFSQGLRYRVHVKNLPGNPDIVLPKYKTVIFINGCFWHGHEGCKYFVLPKTRTEWWVEKITGTQKRDSEAEDKLKLRGWDVIRIWECELKPACISKTLEKLGTQISL
jgi:DNA mismatch endonuclease, patch repair protein